MVFNILMDKHRRPPKNQALLRQAMATTAPQGLSDQAMASTLINALSQARRFGLRSDAARAVIQEVRTGVAAREGGITGNGVMGQDIDLLAQYIDGEKLRLQRGGSAVRRSAALKQSLGP